MADFEWEDVEALYEAARARPADERDAFLKEACDDPVVRQEVASLLEAREEASGFFDDLAESVGGSAPPPPESEEKGRQRAADPLDLEGTQVGRYAVETHLGSGGMGVVYRAHDPQLDRPVVLKFLPSHLSVHPEAERRFAREAKAASVLEHSNIATIYEIGRAEAGPAEGQRFIAMAYYEGETLREKLRREGALAVEEALRYAEQIAEALSRAHEAGIVHRDVKPANVMVTETGDVKLLDFGLAKAAAETRLTDPGQQMGTAAYMSPEQAEGEEVNRQADVWALGALLYEMLAGERPFQGERSSAVVHAILHETPVPLAEQRDDVSPELEQVVARCLQKDPERRYSSAEALLEDLDSLGSSPETAPAQPPSSRESPPGPSSWHGRLIAAAGLLIAVAALAWVLWPTGRTSPPSDVHSVAVLPFEVSGAGAETWRDGMVTALSLNLDGAAGLRTIADRTVFATLEERGLAQEGLDTREALDVARAIGARYAIVGSALQMGGDLRLSSDIRRTASGKRLGTVQVSGSPDSAMVLANELTRKVLGVLLEKSEERIPSVDLASMTTSSLPALKAYLRGERHYRAGAYEAALDDFERATRQDSSFALAYARLGLSRSMITGAFGAGAPYWRQAYKWADQLPRRERGLVTAWYLRYHQDQGMAAADTLRQLSEAYPDDPSIWAALGEVLWHTRIPRGLHEADRAFQRAIDLDSGVVVYQLHPMGLALSLHRDSAMAAQRIAAAPETPEKPLYRLASDLVFGDAARRQEALARLDTVSFRAEALPLWPVPTSLMHPVDGALQETAFQRIARRDDIEGNPYAVWRVGNSLDRGRPEQALAQMRNLDLTPASRSGSTSMSCLLAGELSLGTPLPDTTLHAYVSHSEMETGTSIQRLRCAGLYLLEEARNEKLPALIRRLRRTGGRQDVLNRKVQAAVDELKGYRAFRDGNLHRAEQHWSGHNESGVWGAIWRGDLYRKRGQRRKAEGWYRAAWWHPVAHERLGQLYEEMDKPEKAAAAYERFITAWKNADPALQNRAEKARERLDALGRAETAE